MADVREISRSYAPPPVRQRNTDVPPRRTQRTPGDKDRKPESTNDPARDDDHSLDEYV